MTALRDQHESFQNSLQRWRAAQLETFAPDVRELILARVHDLDQTDYVAANRFCRRLTHSLERAHVGRAFDEEELRACADNFSTVCARSRIPDPRELLARLGGRRPSREPGDGGQELRAFAAKASFAATVGLPTLPANRTMRFHGLSARLDDPLWWRRQLRKLWSRSAEHSLRELGKVRKGRDVYCSEDAVRLRADQKRRIKRYTDDSIAINELGETLELSQIVERSLANPGLRRGELMARIRGFDEVAELAHLQATFATITCPSEFHAELAAAGRNPRYAGHGVRDAQAWLCKTWSRCRAQFRKRGLEPFAFRIAEPHHDGTPHWHVLLFGAKAELDVVSRVISTQYLKEYATEAGAQAHRVCFETIDRSRGSAVGYLAKYIAKNIDGQGVIGTEPSCETGRGSGSGEGTGVGVLDGIRRVEAWASLWGIRQFQQIGGPPVGLYRELRRLRDPIATDADLERVRACADRGDWRAFCLNVGYPFKKDAAQHKLERVWRNERTFPLFDIRDPWGGRRILLKQPRPRLPRANVRYWTAETGRFNRYGEACGPQIVGLRLSSREILTRPHRWILQRKQLSAGGGACDSARTGSALRMSQELFRSAAGVPAGLGPVALTVTPVGTRTTGDLGELRALNAQKPCQESLQSVAALASRWLRNAISDQVTDWFTKETHSTGPPQ